MVFFSQIIHVKLLLVFNSHQLACCFSAKHLIHIRHTCILVKVIPVWPTSWTPAVGGLFVCECVSVYESVSADMSPYCSAHDEWLIMKLCMYVGYHDANNVSNFGGDPVTPLNLKNVKQIKFVILYSKICAVLVLFAYAGWIDTL